jgi:hypothetical protein
MDRTLFSARKAALGLAALKAVMAAATRCGFCWSKLIAEARV